MAEKVQVSIDAEGNVLKCAKNLAGGECGYTPGAKVCGKCGAMPIEMKMVPVDAEEKGGDWMMGDEMMPAKKKKKGGMALPDDLAMDEDEDGEMMPSKKKAMAEAMEDDEEEMDEEEGAPMPSSKKAMNEEMDDEEDEEEDDMEEEDSDMAVDLEAAKKKRLASLGEKSAEYGKNAYMCAIERKVYPGGVSVCDDCPGGCVSEKGMPGLLHVEGLAEQMFEGKILDSGYSSDADMFVVDVQTKSGKAVEVFVDGTTAEVLGWHKLDDSNFEQKSALESMMVIDFQEAAEIAVKSIQGDVVAVEPDIFEGFDAYAVEIEGIDGKSYDVFVALDGEVLGYDKYEPEEAEDIEAEAAEIALKRAFSDEMRQQMAKEGNALPDGSYPIASVDDLKNAIQAFGRAKDKEATKKHIMKRARALGQEKLIPSNWIGGTEEKSAELPEDIKASLIEFELLSEEVSNQENN
jgi:hypothetical protein